MKTVRSVILNNKVAFILILGAIVLSLTPLYGLAYITAITLAVRTLKFSKTFSTIFGRIVLSLLTLMATIMITGLAVWLIDVKIYPILVIISYITLLVVLRRIKYRDVSSSRFIDKGDIISIILASLAPLVILVSYQLPNPSHAASYQFLSNSWDNSSHVLTLSTAARENSYIYGKYDDVKNKTIHKSNAYPQAWHLATSNFVGGFALNPMKSDDHLLSMNAYIVILVGWYLIAVFTITRTSWSITQATIRRIRTRDRVVDLTIFTLASVLIQLLVLWGSLHHGFANYLGLIAFVGVMSSFVYDRPDDEIWSHYLMSILMGAAGILCWFLPLPAIILSATALLYAHPALKPRKSVGTKMPRILKLITVLLVLAIAMQVLIFFMYDTVGGLDQLNAGGSSFTIEGLLTGLVVIFTLTAGNRLLGKNRLLFSKFTSIVFPMLIVTLTVYLYQVITIGETSYYYHKLAGLSILLSGLFLAPFMIYLFSSMLAGSRFIKLGSTVILFVFIMIGTSQPYANLNGLFERNSRIPYRTSKEIVHFLDNYDTKTHRLIVLRGVDFYEDYGSNLFYNLTRAPHTCEFGIIHNEKAKYIDASISRLNDCAKTSKNKLVVITSNKTKNIVENLNRDNIETINVP